MTQTVVDPSSRDKAASSRKDGQMKANSWIKGGLLAIAGLSSPAWALLDINPVPVGTLTFEAASGDVGPTDVIPVMVRLTLADDSAPFMGLNSGNYEEFASVLPEGFHIDFASISYSFTHGGTFSTNGISGPPYDFRFASDSPLDNVSLQAGESATFEFGRFTPSNGPVAPGTYFGNQLSVNFAFTDNSQPDPNAPVGSPNGWTTYLAIASTCSNCFQRTVVAAVPEPESYAMLLAGLGLMGWIVRRRST
jgi:hypothetical protein